MNQYTTLDTPAGPFTYVVSDAGAVRAAGFTAEVDELLPLVHEKLREETRPAADPGVVGAAVRSYLDGDLAAIDDVVVEQHTGGPFLAHAWQVMREIKPGAPVTYTRFAELAGRPAAIRAAATACARNAAALFVPCHRVLGTDGTLRGYRWGLDVKTWLLAHERPPVR
ncbi:methylated-DNA--[protein]-cysteine S-methyltransferase [Actinoplanes sp. NPDC051859]|uniref:methylated-DNA--[protein]-cysteine S-methyltransferase n=1 Tax=Actinoplanes sp. NPDC051859 TaxID=3363909 RepID=UPI00379AAB6B